jgi:hypothetical protein
MDTENIKPPVNDNDVYFGKVSWNLHAYLSVQKRDTGFFEFSSMTRVQSPAQKVKVSYEAIALLDHEKMRVIFWEKMVERSSGIKAGFFSERYVQKGKEVSKEISGHLLLGGKYGFEYGKLREVIRSIAALRAINLKPQYSGRRLKNKAWCTYCTISFLFLLREGGIHENKVYPLPLPGNFYWSCYCNSYDD